VSSSEIDTTMLIITHSNFTEGANRLATWNTRKGFKAIVKTTAEIGSTSNAIKQYVHDMYQSLTPKPEYLILLGDDNYVVSERYPVGTVSDLRYVCMDGDNDIYPEMAYGRISVASASNANKVVDKIIRYETVPPTDASFYSKGLSAGYFQDVGWGDPADGYAARRFAQTSEEQRVYLNGLGYNFEMCYEAESSGFDPTNWNDGTYSWGEEIPDYLKKPNYSWNGNATQISSAINNGCFLVLHRDHGSITSWGHPYYSTTHINGLTNGEKQPIVLSLNCSSGSFQYSCFCEAFLRNENGGCVGIVGATKTSYSGYNDALSEGMVDAIWPGLVPSFPHNPDPSVTPHDPIYKMGHVVNQGKLRMEETWEDPWGHNKHTFRIFHYFGDPSMEIWTGTPSQFTAVNVDDNVSSITANTGGVPNCNICVSSGNNGADYHELESNVQQATFNGITDNDRPLYITITKHNYLPYTAVTGGTFTSDETWFGNLYVLGDVYVSSVNTLTIESGTAVNLNGNIINKGTGEIILESGATVNPHYCIKTGNTINGFYPTLNSALSNVSSGQTIVVKSSTALTENITVPADVTLWIEAPVTLNSYTVTRASGASIVVLSQNNPDVRLQSGSTIIGLYPSINSGMSACASGQYVHARGSHILTGDLTVSSNKNLKIYSGANITFPDYNEMRVYGKLDAQGTSSNKITFTSADGTPNNYENAYLIRFYNSSSNNSILKNCILKNAQRGVYFDHSNAKIEDSEIKRCGYGIYNYYSNSICQDNNINDVTYGIYNYHSSPQIDYTEISNTSSMGIWFESYSSPYYLEHNYLHDDFVLFGVYANNNSNPIFGIGSCDIDIGRNTFDYDDFDLAVIYAGSNCNIMAENNYWGTPNPSSGLFSGNVDWQPYLTSQPSFNIQGDSPEVSEFDIAFSKNSVEVDRIVTDVLSLYDQNWNLKKKTRFIQIMIHNGQAQNVHALCKDIIRDYPDSSGAFFALDLLYQASRVKNMESGKDIEAFKNYLVDLSQNNDIKEIYGSAELLFAGFEREKGITIIDNVFKKYRNTFIAETALFQKFMHYYNENGDDEISRNVLAELENYFSNSEYTLQAYHILGERTNEVFQYNIATNKNNGTEKEKKKEDLKILPQKYELCGVFPNPFNPATIIKYALPYESQISISIYNIMGENVKNIEFSNQSAGNHQMIWDGTNKNSVRVPSGVYIVKFKAISNDDDNNDIFMKTMKMTILK